MGVKVYDGTSGQWVEFAMGSSSDSSVPTGTIVAYGGNSAPTGWQLCNGGTASSSALQTVLGQSNVPDLRDRFIIGAGNSYSRHNTGGSKDATLVSHSHTINNHSHAFSGSNTHNHNFKSVYTGADADENNDGIADQSDEGLSGYYQSENATISISGNTGNPSDRGTNAQGSSATNANLPPYYALVFIIKT